MPTYGYAQWIVVTSASLLIILVIITPLPLLATPLPLLVTPLPPLATPVSPTATPTAPLATPTTSMQLEADGHNAQRHAAIRADNVIYSDQGIHKTSYSDQGIHKTSYSGDSLHDTAGDTEVAPSHKVDTALLHTVGVSRLKHSHLLIDPLHDSRKPLIHTELNGLLHPASIQHMTDLRTGSRIFGKRPLNTFTHSLNFSLLFDHIKLSSKREHQQPISFQRENSNTSHIIPPAVSNSLMRSMITNFRKVSNQTHEARDKEGLGTWPHTGTTPRGKRSVTSSVSRLAHPSWDGHTHTDLMTQSSGDDEVYHAFLRDLSRSVAHDVLSMLVRHGSGDNDDATERKGYGDMDTVSKTPGFGEHLNIPLEAERASIDTSLTHIDGGTAGIGVTKRDRTTRMMALLRQRVRTSGRRTRGRRLHRTEQIARRKQARRPLRMFTPQESTCPAETDGTAPMTCQSDPSICLYDVMICDGARQCPGGEDESFTLCVLRHWFSRFLRQNDRT